MKSRDFLSYYATQFATVEVDSTFYGCPSASTVNNWSARTPEDFIFSVKIPQVITHEKVLVDCDAEFEEFVKTMDILGPKLGPMVFQFPLFDRWKFPKQDSFLAVLEPFLKKLPTDHKFVIEIRNKNWLDRRFANVLQEYNVALALTDTSFMPRPWELKERFDLVTADFAYARWLGDRKGIEEQTTTWDKTVIDRTSDLKPLGGGLQIASEQYESLEDFCLQQQPLRRAWAKHGKTLLGLVEQETIELSLRAQFPLERAGEADSFSKYAWRFFGVGPNPVHNLV